jgi:hypothetical protein
VIRRDYVLRMIQDFFEVLSRIQSLKKNQHWREAGIEIDEEFRRLVGSGAESVAGLSETELLACLIRGEPTQIVHTKTLLLASLLLEAGDVANEQGRFEAGRSRYLKGLHLLLQEEARGEVSDWPDFVPKIEVFAKALSDAPVPLATHAMLMHHYERIGEFAKAEDSLFAMLDTDSANPNLIEFGLAFYERLRHQTDTALKAGALPRPEIEAGLSELRDRQARLQQ